MEEIKRDIKQKLVNSANALAAAADAMLEAAEDIQNLEKELSALEKYILDQEKVKQKIIKMLTANDSQT